MRFQNYILKYKYFFGTHSRTNLFTLEYIQTILLTLLRFYKLGNFNQISTIIQYSAVIHFNYEL